MNTEYERLRRKSTQELVQIVLNADFMQSVVARWILNQREQEARV